jgi:ATP-dependent RNA helicase SUPV3L1/SUV3
MADTREPIDVAVIDEAQMIFDSSRGWAWTQAIVACRRAR